MTPPASAGDGSTVSTRYALRLSEAELARYRAIAERARTDEADLWRMAGIVDAARVVDLGCGPGAVLVVMSERVGPAGSATGIDGDPEAVAAARKAIVAAGVDNAAVRLGEAAASEVEPGSMDVAVLRFVLAHNGPAEQALVDHAATLVRPGGCVYLVDVEATMNRIRPPHPIVLELIDRHHAFQAARGNDLQAGLRLGELLAGAGLEVLDHRGRLTMVTRGPGWRPVAWAAREAMVAAGFADAADLARWQAALSDLDQGPVRLTSTMATFFAVGRRAP